VASVREASRARRHSSATDWAVTAVVKE
jgi:hypothetical protein